MFYKIKCNLLKIFNFFLKYFRVYVDHSISKSKIHKLINLIKPHDLGFKLVRFGSKNDGGYLIPNILDSISACFSAGVGNNTEFEKHLKEKNLNIFLADGTIKKNNKLKKFNFLKKNLSSYSDKKNITLTEWVDNNNIKKKNNLLLKLDIEGSEYEVIHSVPQNYLKMFKVIIIEFHYLEKLNNILNYKIFFNCFKKILINFEVAHIHPNNCQGYYVVAGEKFPAALEVSFLRKDICKYKKNIFSLPNSLDSKNIEKNPDVVLPKNRFS